MGVGSCVSDFVSAGIAWSDSKLWSALNRRHSSPSGSSPAPDDDVPATGCGWTSHVIRDSHPGSLVEAAVSKLQAFLGNCRNPNRRGVHVQPGLARAVTSLENHRFRVGLQRSLDDSAGHREARTLPNSRPRSVMEEVDFPAASNSYD